MQLNKNTEKNEDDELLNISTDKLPGAQDDSKNKIDVDLKMNVGKFLLGKGIRIFLQESENLRLLER